VAAANFVRVSVSSGSAKFLVRRRGLSTVGITSVPLLCRPRPAVGEAHFSRATAHCPRAESPGGGGRAAAFRPHLHHRRHRSRTPGRRVRPICQPRDTLAEKPLRDGRGRRNRSLVNRARRETCTCRHVDVQRSSLALKDPRREGRPSRSREPNTVTVSLGRRRRLGAGSGRSLRRRSLLA
jgi:hypothetical protein